jgi:hypothetical protein
MKQLINESQAVGKVVEKIVMNGGCMSIIFTDNTALLAHAGRDYRGRADLDVVTEELEYIYEMLVSEIITQTESDEMEKERVRQREVKRQQRAERNAAAEREQYERLKAKFDK